MPDNAVLLIVTIVVFLIILNFDWFENCGIMKMFQGEPAKKVEGLSTYPFPEPLYNAENSAAQQALPADAGQLNDMYTLGVNREDENRFRPAGAQRRDPLTAEDLLPADAGENPDWFDNPNSTFNLKTAIEREVPEVKIGVDTIGQSKKNASWDLRGNIPVPKFMASPWNNSTIEPDTNTRPLC